MAPAGDMFQRGELFKGLSNVFGIADDNLIAGFDVMSRDHDAAVNKVLRICRQANVKLNKYKYLGEVILQSGMSPDPRKIQALMAILPPKCKKELHHS